MKCCMRLQEDEEEVRLCDEAKVAVSGLIGSGFRDVHALPFGFRVVALGFMS